MLYLAAGLLVFMTQAVEIKDTARAIQFLEENVYGILRQGDFPEYFGMGAEQMRTLGCKFAPKKVKFGREMGYFCVRERGGPVVPKASNFATCSDMFSLEIAIICPEQWVAECSLGCTVPEMSTTEALEFWELAIAEIIKSGYDYTGPTYEYIKNCGCASDNVNLITHGSGVGFDCVLKPGMEESFDKEQCWNGHYLCKRGDDPVMTFCPIGYIPTCSGCLPGVPGLVVDREGNIDDSGVGKTTMKEQLGWLVEILAGYSRQSQNYIGWMPSPARALACSCKTEMLPVEYGMSIGYWCEIWDEASINHEICRHNAVCMSPKGAHVLHMCPDGFLPSCATGCNYPWNIE